MGTRSRLISILELLCVFALKLTIVSCSDSQPIVTTEHGPVQGTTINQGGNVEAFYGIPFAAPPVGSLRFKKPQPPTAWTDVYNADELAPACYQLKDETYPGFNGSNMWNPQNEITEDCLKLNLWRPKGAKNLTVMVWIFGGGFWSGSPSLPIYNGQILAEKRNVIIVNINYRVSVFGFLYLGTDEAPGNQGLLDQQLAMQWVKNNIEAFGGNPNSITLFGESAGSGSVSAHMIAPGSRNLYNNAILQSGSVGCPWIRYQTPENQYRYSKDLARGVNCEQSDTSELVDCLRKVDPANIAQAMSKLDYGIFVLSFGPITYDGDFFRKNLSAMMRDKEFKATPILIGNMEDEFSFFTVYSYPDYFKRTSTLPTVTTTQFSQLINKTFGQYDSVLKNGIQYKYGTSDQGSCIADGTKLASNAIKFMSDYFLDCCTIFQATAIAEKNIPVYYYRFKFRSSTNPWPKWMGAMHGYEIEYVFGIPLLNSSNQKLDEDVNEFSETLMDYWTNFAKTGKPTSTRVAEKWPKFTVENFEHMELGQTPNSGSSVTTIKPRLRGNQERMDTCKMWKGFFDIRDKMVFAKYTSSDPSHAAILLPGMIVSFIAITSITLCLYY